MKKINDWENIKEADEFTSIKPGGYIAYIKNIQDDTQKEYLKVSYDIKEGEFKDYYMNLYQSQNFWGGAFYRSYKENAQSFFKGFITAVEKSNQGYKWDWNEQGLKGKLIGIVLQEEEYIPQQGKHAGKVRTRLIVQETRSVDEIRKGNYTVKEKKTLSNKKTSFEEDRKIDEMFDSNSFDITEDDIEF